MSNITPNSINSKNAKVFPMSSSRTHDTYAHALTEENIVKYVNAFSGRKTFIISCGSTTNNVEVECVINGYWIKTLVPMPTPRPADGKLWLILSTYKSSGRVVSGDTETDTTDNTGAKISKINCLHYAILDTKTTIENYLTSVSSDDVFLDKDQTPLLIGTFKGNSFVTNAEDKGSLLEIDGGDLG